MRTTLLVGNPKPSSRTLEVARLVAGAVLDSDEAAVEIDLAAHAAHVFMWPSPDMENLIERVRSSDVLIVASPTYKAAYTGLLKAFLDRFPDQGLADVCAVPVMTGGSAGHSLAPDTTLRPLLAALGAQVPSQSLYVDMQRFEQVRDMVEDWASRNVDAIRALTLR